MQDKIWNIFKLKQRIRIVPFFELRARLHQASASTQSQGCDDARNTGLIENNGNK